MSEVRGIADEVEAEDAEYSKDYWDIVFDQLSKRRLVKLALATLAVLYGLAIYAPLIANDRPYVLEAIAYRDYDQARRSLRPIALGLRGIVRRTPEEYLAERTEGSDQTYGQALAAERDAIAGRIATMKRYLPEEEHAVLDAFLDDARQAVLWAAAGRQEDAAAVATDLKDRARDLAAALEPIREEESGQGKVRLRHAVSYPLRDATTSFEVFFMVLWGFVLAWPLWNRLVNRVLARGDRERIRALRRRKWATVFLCSVLCAVGWELAIGGDMTFNVAPFKEQLSAGDLEARRVVFPPIALGFAETHLAEQFRPPTWTGSAEISEEGHYVRGPRSPREQPGGVQAVPTPVDVRFGEAARNSPWRHPIGTDNLGRDLLVRALYGARVSLSVGLVSTVILMAIGIVIGTVAGYFGGRVDLVISRFIEVVICFPVFFLILVVVAFVGPSILNIMVVIGLLRWTGVARLARGEFLRLKELDFVVSARALGFSSTRIVFRHMLPNAMGPLLVAASFSVAAGILTESALSFLGFGIRLPIPSWGSLVNESKNAAHWWIHVFPGLLIFVTVLCYNLVGDGVRDAMDPKLKA